MQNWIAEHEYDTYAKWYRQMDNKKRKKTKITLSHQTIQLSMILSAFFLFICWEYRYSRLQIEARPFCTGWILSDSIKMILFFRHKLRLWFYMCPQSMLKNTNCLPAIKSLTAKYDREMCVFFFSTSPSMNSDIENWLEQIGPIIFHSQR